MSCISTLCIFSQPIICTKRLRIIELSRPRSLYNAVYRLLVQWYLITAAFATAADDDNDVAAAYNGNVTSDYVPQLRVFWYANFSCSTHLTADILTAAISSPFAVHVHYEVPADRASVRLVHFSSFLECRGSGARSPAEWSRLQRHVLLRRASTFRSKEKEKLRKKTEAESRNTVSHLNTEYSPTRRHVRATHGKPDYIRVQQREESNYIKDYDCWSSLTHLGTL